MVVRRLLADKGRNHPCYATQFDMEGEICGFTSERTHSEGDSSGWSDGNVNESGLFAWGNIRDSGLRCRREDVQKQIRWKSIRNIRRKIHVLLRKAAVLRFGRKVATGHVDQEVDRLETKGHVECDGRSTSGRPCFV